VAGARASSTRSRIGSKSGGQRILRCYPLHGGVRLWRTVRRARGASAALVASPHAPRVRARLSSLPSDVQPPSSGMPSARAARHRAGRVTSAPGAHSTNATVIVHRLRRGAGLGAGDSVWRRRASLLHLSVRGRRVRGHGSSSLVGSAAAHRALRRDACWRRPHVRLVAWTPLIGDGGHGAVTGTSTGFEHARLRGSAADTSSARRAPTLLSARRSGSGRAVGRAVSTAEIDSAGGWTAGTPLGPTCSFSPAVVTEADALPSPRDSSAISPASPRLARIDLGCPSAVTVAAGCAEPVRHSASPTCALALARGLPPRARAGGVAPRLIARRRAACTSESTTVVGFDPALPPRAASGRGLGATTRLPPRSSKTRRSRLVVPLPSLRGLAHLCAASRGASWRRAGARGRRFDGWRFDEQSGLLFDLATRASDTPDAVTMIARLREALCIAGGDSREALTSCVRSRRCRWSLRALPFYPLSGSTPRAVRGARRSRLIAGRLDWPSTISFRASVAVRR